MKKFILATLMLGMAATSQAQAPFGLPFSAIGYDGQLSQITARLPLGADNLDLGVALAIDNAEAEPFSMGLSAYYLKKTNTWGPVSLHLVGGANFAILHQANDRAKLSLLAGLQPELVLLERLVFSTRLGLNMDVLPEFAFYTGGPEDGMSIIGGASFKVLF